MRETMTISMPKEIAAIVKNEVASGNFATTSEFMRHLVRLYKENAFAEELGRRKEEPLIEIKAWSGLDK